MPVTLPPISRSSFFRRLGISALSLPSLIHAAAREQDESTLALLADTHVAENKELALRGVTMAANVEKVAAAIRHRRDAIQHVLLNGDCAYLAGMPGDYRVLAGLLQPLRESGRTIHMTLGNHDDRANFRQGLAESKEGQGAVVGKHAVVLKLPHANWFLLDSLEAVNKTPGSLGVEQLKWLAKELDANSNKPAVLFGHHNPHLQEVENKTGLKDTEKLLEVMRPRKQVKAYIFGHTHNWEVKTDDSGIHMINLPPVAYVFNASRPNGWVEATLDRKGVSLKLHALSADHPEAGQVKRLAWRRS